MNLQFVIVVLLVALSFTYAAWTLMPQALRVPVAKGLLRLALPTWWRLRLLSAAQASTGCGCSGCDKAPSPQTRAVPAQPLVFHPRKPRP
ncbi:MAG: DUF6587 family protein [Betaproteobacteria bacterium]